MRWLVVGLGLFSVCGLTLAADCQSEKVQTQKMICNTPSLKTMDDVIQILYQQDLVLLGSESLKAEQDAWMAYRDNTCEDKVSCEDVMTQRINQLLVHLTERRVSNLQEGMKLPDDDSLDHYSKEALQLVGEEHYQPWKRRVISTSNANVFEPIAAVFGDEVFVYFKTYTANYKETIHELNLMTMQEHIVTSGAEYQMSVKENKLLLLVSTKDKQNPSFYSYSIGSKMEPVNKGQITKEEYQVWSGRSDRNRRWAISHDGAKLAVITTQIKSMLTDPTLSPKVREFVKKIAHQLNPTMSDDRTIVIYDSHKDQIQIMPDVLDGSKERLWWRIYDMAWTQDDSQIYFDNEGQRLACIWQFDLASNQVTKIVPEHTAITPYPFVYKDKPYLVYVLAHGGYDGSLLLATPPQ